MTRVLLTGGNGFIAAHTLDLLLKRGHSVVTTVRTQDKAEKIKNAYKEYASKGQLKFSIVPDIAKPGAFDETLVSDPLFDVVLHMASPFHFDVTDVKKELLDPAIRGTVEILKSIKAGAPNVKRVVITSSFAAMADPSKGNRPGYTYSEEDWNPVTEQEALENAIAGYSASKTFAEKAAWEFSASETSSFTITTINPPMVFGPVIHNLETLDKINTSNQRILWAAQGKFKDEIPATGLHLWVDVRDVAEAHVTAFENPKAANKRLFTLSGYFSNREIVNIIKKQFPFYKDQPSDSTPGGDYPEGGITGLFNYSDKLSVELLGIEYRSLEECVVDAIKSFQVLGL